MTDPYEVFDQECRASAAEMAQDPAVRKATVDWMEATLPHRYSYNFRWMGRPIIQYPQDIVSLQEIIWNTRPDLIIETGVAHGGSSVFFASMLQLVGGGRVAVVDIEVRPHNRSALESHPMAPHIEIIEADAVAPETIDRVTQLASNADRVMVVLDSNHTHEHVLAELHGYGPLVSQGCYLAVLDTVIQDLPAESYPDRPWGVGNNPRTAVAEYLDGGAPFDVDSSYDDKLLIGSAPGGYLRRRP